MRTAITGFGTTDGLIFDGLSLTSAVYASTGTNTSTLKLYDGTKLEETLTLTGQSYTGDTFFISPTTSSGSEVTLKASSSAVASAATTAAAALGLESTANQSFEASSATTLIGSSSYGDTWFGDTAAFNNDVVENLGGSDVLHLLDLSASQANLAFAGNSSGAFGVLSVTDGSHQASLRFAGSYAAASFAATSDGANGSPIKFVA